MNKVFAVAEPACQHRRTGIMKNILLCGCVAAWVLLSPQVVSAGEAKAAQPGRRVALFDGKNLDAWDVLKCEAVIDNGDILIKAGNGLVQTKKKYRNYVFEYEWKPLKDDKWDSGVYFRYDSVPENKPWPPRYQANLLKGDEGNVGGLPGAKSKGLVKNGEWNSFKLTVRGSTAEMEINGQPAWKATGLDGPENSFIALQAEVPNGGQNRFRNIYITERK
jgi:hypothetical protein